MAEFSESIFVERGFLLSSVHFLLLIRRCTHHDPVRVMAESKSFVEDGLMVSQAKLIVKRRLTPTLMLPAVQSLAVRGARTLCPVPESIGIRP